jgi:hypothetical protein
MADLVVIVPSRGRPEAAAALIQAFGATRTTAQLVFAIDEDDPRREEYYALAGPPQSTVDTGGAPATMVRALNASAVSRATAGNPPFAIGFMGDDHLPRTVGWDERYLAALRELGSGIVYGNDLLQGHRLPTQCAMTADIVAALGYMCPPVLRHLYVDNFWRDLGKAAGCLRYLADVIIEHRHPLAGKAAWDEDYERVNSGEVAEHDRLAYEAYQRDGFDADVAKVRALLGVAA